MGPRPLLLLARSVVRQGRRAWWCLTRMIQLLKREGRAKAKARASGVGRRTLQGRMTVVKGLRIPEDVGKRLRLP